MGACTARSSEDPGAVRSKYIDNKIKTEQRLDYNNIKMLLLGPGESGKSTIFKQMKIIHDKEPGFTPEERLAFRQVVFANCISQMKVLIVSALNFQIPIVNREAAEKLILLYQQGQTMSEEIAQLITLLWGDNGIQKIYDIRGKKYQLNDTADYFFTNIERISKEDYIPTDDDILRARVRSTGIEEAQFSFEQLTFTVVDVGGQRSERRKWIHCFNCVRVVLFCASLSSYDQVLREDASQNRMAETLLLFDEVANHHFQNKPIILFLNKVDLFEEKYQRVPLTLCFPEYPGETVEDGKAFIKERFIEKAHPKHIIFPHYTCALNTKNMRFVITSIRKEIMRGQMNDEIFVDDIL
jgi:GTPase SAR1 family protein